MDNTKHHGEHAHQAAHQAKGLQYFGLKSDGTYVGPEDSRAAAKAAMGGDANGRVVRFNPHQSEDEAAADDAAAAL